MKTLNILLATVALTITANAGTITGIATSPDEQYTVTAGDTLTLQTLSGAAAATILPDCNGTIGVNWDPMSTACIISQQIDSKTTLYLLTQQAAQLQWQTNKIDDSEQVNNFYEETFQSKDLSAIKAEFASEIKTVTEWNREKNTATIALQTTLKSGQVLEYSYKIGL